MGDSGGLMQKGSLSLLFIPPTHSLVCLASKINEKYYSSSKQNDKNRINGSLPWT